ncbi:type IV secretion system TrbL domain protein [Helicobacter pylori Hp H-44]|nr:type IV secretion system TrbL domain protein [Helicobacter pylori Hp H-44]
MNFFDTIMGMFVEPSQKVAKSLAEHVGSFFHAQLILNTIITILFMIWAYKRVKEGDMFEFKTAMGVVVFIVFVGFINWGIRNPNDFNTYFINTIFYPAEKLAILIAQSLNDGLEIPTDANASPSETFNIGNLVSSAYAMIANLWDNAFDGISMFNWLTMIPKIIMFFFSDFRGIIVFRLIAYYCVISYSRNFYVVSIRFNCIAFRFNPPSQRHVI